MAAVKEFVEHKKIDCDFYLTRALDVYLDSGHATEVEGSYQELLRIGAASLGDVQFIANKDAERVRKQSTSAKSHSTNTSLGLDIWSKRREMLFLIYCGSHMALQADLASAS